MAGVRQHFIPRFLQKGFKAPRKGKGTYCWVYEKDKTPRPANIQDVGLERHFYAVEAESELDDKITMDEERIYAPLLDRLRAGELHDDVVHQIPGLLAHFEIRSRHVRQSIQLTIDGFATQLLTQLADPIILGKLIERHLRPGSTFFQQELAKTGLTEEQFQGILELTGVTIEEILRPLVSQAAESMPGLLDSFRGSLPALVRQSHVRILNQSIAPHLRAQRFIPLHYSVETFAPNNLPLGDLIVLFRVNGERAFKPFLDKDDELVAVILPLAQDRYLLGSSLASNSNLGFDLPAEIACCSLEYFISGHNDEKTIELHQMVGANSHWILRDDVDPLLDDVFRKLMSEELE